MSAAQGRFTSADPLGDFVANAADPQSWNMYAYARNNPLAFVDPTGTDYCSWSDDSGENLAPEFGGLTEDDCAFAGGTWAYSYDITDNVNQYNSGQTTFYLDNWLDQWSAENGPLDSGFTSYTPVTALAPSSPGALPGQQNNTRCAPGVSGAGFGWVLGGSAGLGFGPNGGYGMSAAGAIGGGTFTGGGNTTSGTFGSAGVAATDQGGLGNYPPNTSGSSNKTYGIFAGLGGGVFLTNAGNSTSLLGPFTSDILAIGIYGLELDHANGTWVASVTVGKSMGLGLTRLQTKTVAAACK